MTPSAKLSWATTSGVPPPRAILSTSASSRAGARPPCSSTKRLTASAAPLRSLRPSRSTPLIRVVAEKGMNVASCSASSRPRRPYRSLARTTIERPSGEFAFGDAVDGDELGRLPVAERDRAGLVQEEHVDVAGRLDRAAGHGEHVALHEPVHARDPDRREQRADGGRDQRDEQSDEHRL